MRDSRPSRAAARWSSLTDPDGHRVEVVAGQAPAEPAADRRRPSPGTVPRPRTTPADAPSASPPAPPRSCASGTSCSTSRTSAPPSGGTRSASASSPPTRSGFAGVRARRLPALRPRRDAHRSPHPVPDAGPQGARLQPRRLRGRRPGRPDARPPAAEATPAGTPNGASAATSWAARCSTTGAIRGATRWSTGPTATCSPPPMARTSPPCRTCWASSGVRAAADDGLRGRSMKLATFDAGAAPAAGRRDRRPDRPAQRGRAAACLAT